MNLEDMGFIMRPVTTPAQMERLRLLPPRRYLRHTAEKGDRRYYLYADPDFCQCVFLGNEPAMKNVLSARFAIVRAADADKVRTVAPYARARWRFEELDTLHQRDDRKRRYSRLFIRTQKDGANFLSSCSAASSAPLILPWVICVAPMSTAWPRHRSDRYRNVVAFNRS